MKSLIYYFLLLLMILAVPITVAAAPMEVYTDPETGHEVWRMTNNSSRDMMQYYDWPTISPNGKYLIFRANRAPLIYIINSDGSGEKPLGDYSTWNSQRGLDFGNQMQGWWSNDSRYYYIYNKLYVVDIEKFQSGATPASYISQISSTYGNNFYYPMLSPDGRKLYGVSVYQDSPAGGTLKFINIDGTGYKEFVPPLYLSHTGKNLDVTHGWLGNDQAWYMNSDNDDYDSTVDVVINVSDGTKASATPILEPKDPVGNDLWYGLLAHITESPSAYYIGNGEGLVAGHGRNYKFSNTKYWTQDPVERQTTILTSTQVANHYAFSPDGKWLATGDYMGPNPAFIVAYPVKSYGAPVKIARYTYNSNPGSFDNSTDPRFSPDGTKNIFYGDVRAAGNFDIYMAIFKKPDSPTNLSAVVEGSSVKITFKPAAMHREIKEYEIYKASSQNGTYTKIGVLPETVTYLNTPSKIGAGDATIYVDDTTNFPASGVIEISGLSTEKPNELVSYTGKTATSFTGCVRGYGGTTTAQHYNDSFVWRYTGSFGYVDSLTSGPWYKVKSTEWSGLQSGLSDPVSVNTTTIPSATPTPITTLTPTNPPILTPTSPPTSFIISNVQATNITQTGATINWDLSDYGTGQVQYGTTTAYGLFSTAETSFSWKSHSQTLNNLTPNALYHYRTLSIDRYGHSAVSNNYTFTTLGPTPTPTPKPGDADGNGKVDDLDYTIWANNYGITNATGPKQGDFNNDHKVNDLDYTIWANNYGK